MLFLTGVALPASCPQSSNGESLPERREKEFDAGQIKLIFSPSQH
jgi:hypothetical protein